MTTDFEVGDQEVNDSSWTDVFGLADKENGKRLKLLVGVIAVIGAFAALTTTSNAVGTFNPSITFETSTTRASSHPDARITIDNTNSDESIKSVAVQMPDGFMGSLAAATKCTGDAADPSTESDPPGATGTFGDCPGSSQIGTVVTEAIIDQSTVRIKGKVFLADAAPANADTDPASIIIRVEPVVGAVEFEDVILSARVQARYGPRSPASAPTGVIGATGVSGAFGPIKGINTEVADIPDQVDDDDGVYDPVVFVIRKMQLDLKSRFTDIENAPPLLTNPSSCTAASLNATYVSSSTSISDSDSVSYTPTGCSTVKFNPEFETTLTNPSSGSVSKLDSLVDFGADNGSGVGSVNNVQVTLPPSFTVNFSSFGSSVDQCPSFASTATFYPDNCPKQAQIGTATIDTPLLPEPVTGKVFFINNGNNPSLGIDVSHFTDSDVPRGIVLRLLGATGVTFQNGQGSVCQDIDQFDSCQTLLQVTFSSTPDAPVRSIALHMGSDDNRPVDPGGTPTLSGSPLAIASSADGTCQPTADMTIRLRGTANPAPALATNRVQPFNTSPCDVSPPPLTGGPVATLADPSLAETTDTTPTFTFPAAPGLECAIDTPTGYDVLGGGYTGAPRVDCSSGTFTPSALGTAIHRVYVSGGAKTVDRAFVVKSASTQDDTLPTTTIDSGPADAGTTDTATPQFTFSSSEASSTFDCAVDDGAFLPCTSPYTTPTLTAGVEHTFEVRATDPAGNLDITPDSRTFTVDVPFDPQITVTPSTTAARAHPDLDVKITSGSHTDIKDLTLAMPDGFFGGLTGVQQVCTLAQADVVQQDPDAPSENQPIVKGPTNCPATSKVGTVTATGEITSPDGLVPSEAVLSGDIFLTDGRAFDEPAGIMISIHAKISTVDLGYINVPARLKLREHALGIDSLAIDIPNSITSVDGTTEFDMREMDLHLESDSGGSQPLLVNPSSCKPASFKASFTSYGPATETSDDDSPFQVTGCGGLNFSPQLSANVADVITGAPPVHSTDGRSVSATMTATLAADPNGAGIDRVTALLPKPLTINLTKLPKRCLIVEYETTGCDASTIVGSASANTPLLSEPITGNIYLLQALGGNVTPRLLIALRGKINTDIIAVNRFVSPTSTQIITEFTDLPDAPITSFNLTVSNVVSTLIEACDTPPSDWNITGTYYGHNGAATPINAPLKFGCNGVGYKYRFTKRGNKSKLSFGAQAQGELANMKSLKIQAPKGMSFNARKGITKKLTIRADGKKLKSKCAKVTGRKKNVITINLCKKKVRKIDLTFGAGSLKVAKRFSNKSKVTVSPSLVSGKVSRQKLLLDSDSFTRTYLIP